MPLSPEAAERHCAHVLAGDSPPLDLADYLAAIPTLESLAHLPSGTAVLVRGDVDCKPGDKVGDGDVRLRSMLATLEFGRARGWRQIIFGHIGREPEKSLAKVAKRLGDLVGFPVPLLSDWYNEAVGEVTAEAAAAIRAVPAGGVLVLENTRRYNVERALWKAKPAELAGLAPQLAAFANQLAERVARVYVNEALSAGSLDASTTVVPAAMDRVALGDYVRREFEGPMLRCLAAQLVIFSGLKTDKLDDLEAMTRRGQVRRVISAGSLAMALKKAEAQLDGGDFSLGVAEDPAHAAKPYYISPAAIDQARRIIENGRRAGVKFALPVDFVLEDGSVSAEIPPGRQQFDVGPKTGDHFERAIGEFIAESGRGSVAFYNGVFGMFEDPRFEAGTRRFIGQLKRMKDAGLEVYVGGGEGGAALDKYGQPDWVTHCFTAGGTVLNVLGSEPVPYLVALRAAAQGK